MDADAYTLMASHETDHWWFVGRRSVIDGVLDRLTLPHDARILEAGCGTGGNIYLLQARGDVCAFEPHQAAVAIARARHPGAIIEEGQLPDRLPFEAAGFDLVAALDVLEHVDDDRGAIEALIRQARPGGWVIVSVPTHPYLWGSHDRRLHHKRRYAVAALRELTAVPGTELIYFGAYNTILAPIAFTVRLLERWFGIDLGNQERRPPALINAVLAFAFKLEGRLVRRATLPVGLSHVAVLRRSA
jgi:SAM-dependent methyltransferase